MTALPLNAINARMVTPPPGLEFSSFTNGDGAAIRYASVEPPKDRLVNGKPVGVAFVVTGFRENIERYYELMHDLTERGYAVHAMDWRGQGGSQRYKPDMPQRPHAQGYENDAADLEQFITQVIKPSKRYPGVPTTLFAHSMGGNIALRYLHDYPDRVGAAVITSPMLAIKTRGFPPWVVRQVSRAIDILGAGHRYITHHGDYSEQELKALNTMVSDRNVRQHLHLLFYRDIPEQRLGKPTFGWMRAAFRSMAVLRDPDYLTRIKTPIMLASAGEDNLVWPKAIKRAAGYLPNAVLHHFPKGLHSLWMECNHQRDQLWGQTDRFLEQHLGIAIRDAGKSISADQCRANDNNCADRPAIRLVSGPKAAQRPRPIPPHNMAPPANHPRFQAVMR